MIETILAIGIIPSWILLTYLYRVHENYYGKYTIKEVGFWFCASLFWPVSLPFVTVATITERLEVRRRRGK